MPQQSGVTDVVSVETPESVAFAYELAGVGSRGLAFAVDQLIITGIVLGEAAAVGVVLLLSFYAFGTNLVTVAGVWLGSGFVLAAFLTYWLYFIFGEVLRAGRTPGKRRLGIRVVRDDGSRVSFVDSAIRNILRLVDALPGTYAIGIVAVLASKRNKRLGDMAAGTVVVRDAGELALLSDGGPDAEREALAREFLARRALLTPEARHQVAVEVLRAFGEEPGAGWDEPTIAGRLADLAGARPSVDAEGRIA